MGILQLNTHNISTLFTIPLIDPLKNLNCNLSFSRLKRFSIARVRTDTESEIKPSTQENDEENSTVNFAFVSSALLPDGTPDVHYRTAGGGQKLRDIMLDNDIELYGPYARPLLNCAGGGTCATCMVEIVGGIELLSLRTEKEKEKLKKKPKNWRLACQTTVGGPNSRGLVVIQQLPEWKSHEWNYGKEKVPEDEIVDI